MHKFTIYAHYDVMINSEAYSQLKNQLADEKTEHAKEVAELKQQLVDKDNQHKKEINELDHQLELLRNKWQTLVLSEAEAILKRK